MGWLTETIHDLGFVLNKVDSRLNLSDLHTKTISATTAETLLPLIGMRSP